MTPHGTLLMKRALTILLFLCSTTSTAQAADPPANERWYGYQTLIPDGISIIAFLGSITSGIEEIGYIAAGTYALTGPIVHGAHGHWDRAGLSLGMRVLLPPALTYGGAYLGGSTDSRTWDGLVLGVLIGGTIGILTPPIIDATIGKDRIATPQTGLRIAPVIAPSHIGVSGTF
jgi:hypothetical protein